ncbi:MAG TPA: hypothetical protein VI111_05745 [Thermoleophilaceae bacterium]
MHSRAIVFGVICAVCVLGGGAWVTIAALSGSTTTSDAKVAVAGGEKLDVWGKLLVRAVDKGDDRLNGRVTLVSLGQHPSKAAAGGMACERLYVAAGRGLCEYVAASGVDYRVKIFDSRYRTIYEEELPGVPSRARVSPSGRYGSITTFVTGDSYATPGAFSTRTLIYDMRAGKQIANLEQFSVKRDGETIDAPDFNFWGATFAKDDDTFYATLGTRGKRYLVKGSLRAKQLTVIHENVECPSLSPDETRIAYKRRVGAPDDWRLHVLDLASGRDVELAETRSIDDQAEWFDDDTVLYGHDGSVWAVRADGTGSPERVLARAASPATIRG